MNDYIDLCNRFFASPLYRKLGRNPKHAVVAIIIKRIFDCWVKR